MPAIPGYRYDSRRKRYFKLQPGQRDHSLDQAANASRPQKRRKGKPHVKPQHRSGIYRYLKDVETDRKQPSLPVANSLLLSGCKRTHFNNIDYEDPSINISFTQLRKLDHHYRQIARTDEGESLWDMDQVNTFFEVRRTANTVTIGTHLYPLGGSRCTIDASEADTCVSEGSWLAHGGYVGRFYQVCKYRILKIQPREEQRLLLVLRRPFRGTMAISNKGIPALAVQRKVYILDTEAAQRAPRSPRSLAQGLPVHCLTVRSLFTTWHTRPPLYGSPEAISELLTYTHVMMENRFSCPQCLTMKRIWYAGIQEFRTPVLRQYVRRAQEFP
ncbi:hypothetical protein FGB62_25g017 [Gracilaria domingensis]|nr:hypothetical protein FGB62_25g017 [Gracilaria domingensis]